MAGGSSCEEVVGEASGSGEPASPLCWHQSKLNLCNEYTLRKGIGGVQEWFNSFTALISYKLFPFFMTTDMHVYSIACIL